jgi:hypothetical protein
MKITTKEVGDAIQELREAMLANIEIKNKEDSIVLERIAARSRLLRAKETVRALETQ